VATKKTKAKHGKRLKAARKIEEKKPLTVSGFSIGKHTDASSPN
jgi:hypothetical protein